MSDCGNNGGLRIKDCLCYRLFIESPKVFYRSASSPYNESVQAKLIQSLYSPYNRGYRTFSLHKSGEKCDFHKGISSPRNLHNIPHRSAGACRNHANAPCILRNRLLVHGVKEPHFHEFLL